jgi:hypothetical protein
VIDVASNKCFILSSFIKMFKINYISLNMRNTHNSRTMATIAASATTAGTPIRRQNIELSHPKQP